MLRFNKGNILINKSPLVGHPAQSLRAEVRGVSAAGYQIAILPASDLRHVRPVSSNLLSAEISFSVEGAHETFDIVPPGAARTYSSKNSVAHTVDQQDTSIWQALLRHGDGHGG